MTKQADRQRRYRAREKAKAQAVMAGASEIELAWFGINLDGKYVAIPYDGKSIVLTPAVPKAPAEPVEDEPAKKVYVPKVWPADRWNKLVHEVREKKITHANMLGNFKKWEDTELNRTLLAVVKAIPDTPDWYMHLPLAPEKDS